MPKFSDQRRKEGGKKKKKKRHMGSDSFLKGPLGGSVI